MANLGSLVKIECNAECGFMVRSHDREEVKRIAMEHIKTAHKENPTNEDMEKMVEPAMAVI
jgi:predicted small metal-binding protein